MASRWCARYMFYGEDLNIAGVRAGLYTGARPSLGSLERAPSGLIDPTTSWGIHVQIVLSALAPGGRRRARRHHRARRKAVLAQERGHGRAARGRHVRLHGAGAAADGVRSERRHPDVGHRHADLLSVRGRAGAELPGVQFRLHRRRHRRHRLCGRRRQRQYRRGAGRHHRLRPGLYPDRPDRLGRQCARRRGRAGSTR